MTEATPIVPQVSEQITRHRVPTTITRALARGWQLMAEAARYGDQPLPAQLKVRLDRCAEEQRHVLETAQQKRQRSFQHRRFMISAAGMLR